MQVLKVLLCAASLALGASAAMASEPPVTIKTYAISGSTGFQLYQSIADNGPNGGGHVAHTDPKLTWKRLFDERGGDCYLVHARPQLSFVQVYPKPSGKLGPATKRVWDRFITAVRKHEDTHVRMFKEMVAQTEASLVGSVERNDRTCAKVKETVRARIDQAYQDYRQRSRDFDRTDLSPGGAIFIVREALLADR